MATTDEILAAAKKLGELIADHDASKKFSDAIQKLTNDVDAQRAVSDYERTMQMVSQKQAMGQPIEVAEKRKLQELQQIMGTNLTLGQVQQAQMDYLDMKRKAFEAIEAETEIEPDGPMADAGASAGAAGAPGGGASPIIT